MSIDLLSADRTALDGRSRTERELIRLETELDDYATAPWADPNQPERGGLSGFLATISRAFRDSEGDVDPRSARIRAYADGLGPREDADRALAAAFDDDLGQLRSIAVRVDGLRQVMSENWTIAAINEILGVTERAIGVAVRRRDGFSAVCRRLDLSDAEVCHDSMGEYGRHIALLRADAEAAAEMLQRKSASISS